MELDAATGPSERKFNGGMRMTGVARTVLLACALALAGAPAAAQGGCVSLPAASALAADSGRADVVIRASASIRELRFESRPRTSVRTLGCAGLDSVVVTERVNLPDPVEPGVTYRDVRVGVEIRASLGVTCLLPALAADPAFADLCASAAAPTRPAAAPAPQNPPRR
jgi:hypothetical protein